MSLTYDTFASRQGFHWEIKLKQGRMYRINFKFEQPGMDPVSLKDAQPGYSLLEIALNNRIVLHHDCGGICSCSTCHIHLVKGEEFVAEKSKREKDLLEKAVDRQMDSRLACQCLLQEGSGEIVVIIPDQTAYDLKI